MDFVGGMGSLNLTEEPPIDPLFEFCALFKPQDLTEVGFCGFSKSDAPSEVDFVGGMGSLNLTEEPPIDPLFDFCVLFKPQDLTKLDFCGGMASLNLTEDRPLCAHLSSRCFLWGGFLGRHGFPQSD